MDLRFAAAHAALAVASRIDARLRFFYPRQFLSLLIAATFGLLFLLAGSNGLAITAQTQSNISISNSTYEWSGATVDITVTDIDNNNTNGEGTGPLELQLWALPDTYDGANQIGFLLASYQANALAYNFYYPTYDTGSIPYTQPPTGNWHIVLLLKENVNGSWVVDAWVNYNGLQYCSNGSCSTTAPTTPVTPAFTPANGYWWNPAEPGRGYVIEVQGTTLFMAAFLYAGNGEATWVASTGPMASSAQYSGTLITYSGGQTLNGNYQAATQNPGSLGNIGISFTDASHGTLTWPGGTVPIQRFDFGPGGSETAQPGANPQTGWWYVQDEPGRGYAVEIQGETMSFAGYMYDASGNPLWYLSTGAMVNPGFYQGPLAQFANGQTLTGGFQSPSVVNADVGQVSIQFYSPTYGTLTLPTGRQVTLSRFYFGEPTPALTVPVQTADANLVNNGINQSFTISGYINNSTEANPMPNIPFSGSGTYVAGPPTAVTINSGPLAGTQALQKVEIISGTLTANGKSQPLSNNTTTYYNPGNYSTLQENSGTEEFYFTPFTYPASVQAGDTGVLAQASTGGFFADTIKEVYSVAADSPVSLLVTITSTQTTAGGVGALVVTTTVFRITTGGAISLVSQSSSSTLLGLTYQVLTLTFN